MKTKITTLCCLALCAFAAENTVSSLKNSGTVPPPPLPPFVGYFHQWQKEFLQWGLKEGPYTNIEASIDARRTPPLYDVGVEERDSGKRIRFVSDKALQVEYQSVGIESYLTTIQLKKSTDVNGFDNYEFALRDYRERPLVWRFVQATSPSEKGSGLSEIANIKPMILMYRLAGAVAGEGTAVQTGTLVQPAEIWKEISQPPYFIAYKGAMTEGALVGELGIGSSEWKVETAPKNLEAGQSWKLKDKFGHPQTLTVKSYDGTNGVFIIAGDVYGKVQDFADINAKLVDGRWLIQEVRYRDEAQGMRVKMDPGVFASGGGDAKEIKFQIYMAKNQKVTDGIIEASSRDPKSPSTKEFAWHFHSPSWAKKKVILETISTTSAGYRVEAKAPVNQ